MKELLKKFNFHEFIKSLQNKKLAAAGQDTPEISVVLWDNYKKYLNKDEDILDYIEDSDIYELFEDSSNIRNHFQTLDKSFVYTSLYQMIDNDPDGFWYSFDETGYLSSKKTKYSFLINAGDYNSNFSLRVDKVFKNLKTSQIKELSKFAIFPSTHLCNYLMLNNKFNWNIDEVKKKITRLSLEKRKKFHEELKKKIPTHYKRIHICLCDEKKINNREWNPLLLEKNEDYKYINY